MPFKLIRDKSPINEEYKVPFVLHVIGSGLFTGHIPVAPGTFGSLVAFAVFLLLGSSDYLFVWLLVIVFFVAGVYVADLMRKRYGEDPPEVVIDEIVGQWFTYLVALTFFDLSFKAKPFDPNFYFVAKVVFAFIGFLIFRFFDIIKLQPAKYIDQHDSGWAIMFDDIIAGLYAGIVTAPLTHFLWYKFLIRFLI